MIIFIPLDDLDDDLDVGRKALIILRNPHNHPVHPTTKPSVEDQTKLGMATAMERDDEAGRLGCEFKTGCCSETSTDGD
jgi:hypothetical protein